MSDSTAPAPAPEAPDTRSNTEKKHDAIRELLSTKRTPIGEMTPFKAYHPTLPPSQKGKRQTF